MPDWPDLPLTVAAQAVQYSAFPDAYAQWEPQATTLVRGLSGGEQVRATCGEDALAPTADAPTRPARARLRERVPAARGAARRGGRGAGSADRAGISDGGAAATVSAAVPELGAAERGRALAAWSVAHATGFGVTEIDVQDRRWAEHEWDSVEPSPMAPDEVRIRVG